MNDLSEENIRKNCPHCDPSSFAYTFPLTETENFRVVCDVHPMIKGHLLIIPKKHVPCVGELPEELFDEFMNLYRQCSDFLKISYGSVSSFEHGKIGQTVFHSHVHLTPFTGNAKDIIPEGEKELTPIGDLKDLRDIFARDGQYLFFSIGEGKWVVNTRIAAPRFFRDRFARAVGNPDRGNWKEMENDTILMKAGMKENMEVQGKWKKFLTTSQ